MEMKQYRLSILGVTETHLPGEGEMVMNAVAGYSLLYSGRSDRTNVEGVGIALSPPTRAALDTSYPSRPTVDCGSVCHF